MASLKAWWKTTGREIVQFAAVLTVLLTTIAAFGWLIIAAITGLINILGLGWLVRGWVVGAFVYVAFELVTEIQEYKKDPDAYGFWPGDDDEEDEPTETGVK